MFQSAPLRKDWPLEGVTGSRRVIARIGTFITLDRFVKSIAIVSALSASGRNMRKRRGANSSEILLRRNRLILCGFEACRSRSD
jgi:hypothetical protein